jgi:RNA polymerase primary sigma factor
MARVARYRTAAIGDLDRQLRFAPAGTRRRQMDAAERLIRDLEPETPYPLDFVVYRVTGYRPETPSSPVSLGGHALRADLVTFIQRISDRLNLPAEGKGRRGRSLEELATALGVSLKTLQRCRALGLVCHYLVFADGTKRLSCFDDALEAFRAKHGDRLRRASRFTRMDAALRRRIVDEAAAMHAAEDGSLNAIARRLAARHGRAHETMRQLLKQNDRTAPARLFSDPPPLSEREARLIHRAWRLGVSPAATARRLRKDRATIHRAINHRRALLLRSLDLAHIALPTFDRAEAVEVILSAPAVSVGLDRGPPPDDALRLIAALSQTPAPAPPELDALAAGYNLLKRRASAAIAELPDPPPAAALDAIETDLRWATLLKRRLVVAGLPAAVRAIDMNLNRSIRKLGADEMARLITLAVQTTARSIETFDPSRHQQLDRAVSFAMNRALAPLELVRHVHRAAARHAGGSVPLLRLFSALNPWQPWLDLRPDLLPFLPRLNAASATILDMRYGGNGRPPMTWHAIGRVLGVSAAAAARRGWNAEARLLAMARSRAPRD